jgi:hypothetical protein
MGKGIISCMGNRREEFEDSDECEEEEDEVDAGENEVENEGGEDEEDEEVKAYGEGKEVAVLPPTLLTAAYSLLYNSCCMRKLNTGFIQDPSPDKICCGGCK